MNEEIQYCLLYKPHWSERLAALLKSAQTELVLATPFITLKGAAFLKQNTTSAFRKTGKVRLVTNVSSKNMALGVTDPHAIRALTKHFSTVAVTDLRTLHAKIYIADSSRAVITSANLTSSGLMTNLECGTILSTPEVTQLRSYLLAEANKFGVDVSLKIDKLIALAEKLQVNLQAHIAALKKGSDELAIAEGNGDSLNALFQQAIKSVIATEGPLRVREIYPYVQQKHPNLCDDDERDFRNGRFTEPSWKHRIRAAQERLQQNGKLVRLKDGRWALTIASSA